MKKIEKSIMVMVMAVMGIVFFDGKHLYGAQDVPKGVVTVTFDDGAETIFTNGFPILRKYHIPATLFLVTGFIGKDCYYIDWSQAKILVENDWEIGSHTNTHKKLTEISGEQIKSELNESMRILQQHGFDPKAFASPNGAFDKRTLKFIKERFSSHRKAWDERAGNNGINSLNEFNPYRISAISVERDTPTEKIKKKIDQAVKEKKWLVLLFHSIIKKGSDIGQYQIGMEKFEQIIKYIEDDFVQAGKLEVKTISQMVETKQNRRK